ncbi:MAG: hypothetical protein ABSC18_18380 [Verrucomicrobiota bacterium]|jgi:hypothetical protein
MKSGKLILVGCVLLAGFSTAKANSIVLDENSYSYSDGGEFTAFTSPDNFVGSYVPATILDGGFETFCEQSTVYFTPGSSYSYTVVNQDSTGHALSLGAAFLYYEFAKGVLSGYDYVNAANRYADAGELQAAIWWFQGNQTGSGFPSIATDPFYLLAYGDFGAAAFGANSGTYGVEILQLFDCWGDPAQAQFVLTPPTSVPETGATITMLAFACGALALLRGHVRRHALARS